MPARTPLHAAFCTNLLAARKAKGLTQVEAAEALGLSQATYAAFETAKSPPNLLSIEKLAAIFDVTAAELLEQTAIAR